MDNIKFGSFILQLRKEKGWTQSELAEVLHVTNKAVSKWERGVGYPDIKLIEPLAEALDVSVMEIMQSQKIEQREVTSKNADEAISNMIDLVQYQRKIERRNIIISAISITAIVLLIFLIDNMPLVGVFFVCMPVLLGLLGIFLVILSIYRARKKLQYTLTLVCGIMCILYPVIVIVMINIAFFSGLMGVS